jgi:hypothetical protein
MSSPVTIADVYKLFPNAQELAQKLSAEFNRRMAESLADADRRYTGGFGGSE